MHLFSYFDTFPEFCIVLNLDSIHFPKSYNKMSKYIKGSKSVMNGSNVISKVENWMVCFPLSRKKTLHLFLSAELFINCN